MKGSGVDVVWVAGAVFWNGGGGGCHGPADQVRELPCEKQKDPLSITTLLSRKKNRCGSTQASPPRLAWRGGRQASKDGITSGEYVQPAYSPQMVVIPSCILHFPLRHGPPDPVGGLPG